MKNLNNGSNQSTIKSNNKSLVLKILNSAGQSSRAELSRITGLTKTAITNIISELLEEGIIFETGTQASSSGRKPILLKISKNALFSVGVYISRDFVYTNIVNLEGEVLKEYKHALDIIENEKSFLAGIFQSVDAVLSGFGTEMKKILGIGVASIGPIDVKNGIILDPPNFRGLKSIHITRELKERYNLNTYLDNDMNAGAIAEKLFGKAKNISDFIYLGVTNGVGAGIYINNSLFRGNDGFAGEIGHTTIDINGEKCPCGNIGCLELYASIPAMVNQVKKSIELGAASNVSSDGGILWTDIIKAAINGDSLCLNIINKLSFYLSVGLVNTINCFDPEVVFIGHEVALAGKLIVEPLTEMINRNIFFRNSKKINVEVSDFKNLAAHIGAPSIVLSKYFNGEIN
ncbi:MAG: ROK family transcriptional regulator [Acetivibrionales bacterium]|jgi:N-acetylglucosamine repressor